MWNIRRNTESGQLHAHGVSASAIAAIAQVRFVRKPDIKNGAVNLRRAVALADQISSVCSFSHWLKWVTKLVHS